MTVIAAAPTRDGITLACDSQTTAGWEKDIGTQTKIWVAGSYVLGGAGGLREIQVVKHHTSWPTFRPDEDDDPEAFLVKKVVPAIREAVTGHGIVKSDSGVERIAAVFLIAWGGTLAEITGDGCVFMSSRERLAIGSGGEAAIGALGNTGPWTTRSVVQAVQHAIEADIGCGGPIHYASTRTLTVKEA